MGGHDSQSTVYFFDQQYDVCVHISDQLLECCFFLFLRDQAWVGVVLHVLVLLRQGGVDSQKVRGDRWTGVRGREEWGVGLILPIKPVSDTQSASHALAQAIVVWNLRNAFDRFTASAWVLFWTTPGDKTATREGKKRRDRQGAGQGLPDEYMYFNHTLQRPASQRTSAITDFTQKLALSQGEKIKRTCLESTAMFL